MFVPLTPAGTLQEVTISTENVAMDLFSGETPTNGFEVINPSDTDTLYMREGNTAVVTGVSSWPIFPGGGYCTPAGYRPTGPVSVISGVSAHPVIARRW